MQLYKVSAKEGTNVEQMFLSVIDSIREQHDKKKKKFEE